ncbi:MAG: 3-hydroxyacyl-ACP dehydratase FabZ [Deltaproteobacteria bacterium]|jgi:3-hydroxyacyl-[acyl-carrier-protein] dehydratase|nr:3-hydroxyacyl-ACP dehydratase FabZ [Deltaproteobacteria bacterium]
MSQNENVTNNVARKFANGEFDIRKIMEYLPHRYPFLLVDRVLELVPGKSIVAYKNVTFNEPFFQGHFPGVPVMPGVLIMEALAQAGGIMVLSGAEIPPGSDPLFLFTGMDSVRFRRPVVPGDRLELHAEILRSRLRLWKLSCRALVDGQLAAEGELSASMTFKGEL